MNQQCSSRDDAGPVKVICLAPVRNEAWILDRFLQCASTWADQIIVADQLSDDGSPEIARRYSKVILIENPEQAYSEEARQKIMYGRARQIPGKKVLLAIDADEALSANWMTSPEWQALRSAAPGTVIYFRWANLLPDLQAAWMPPENIPMGFVDDGTSEHSRGHFHVPRVPMPPGAPTLVMDEVKCLHYQYADWERMKSKQRGYQCAEMLSNSRKRPIGLYRQYHKMDAVPPERIQPVRQEWFDGYERLGIDMRTIRRDAVYRWDREMIQRFLDHGPGRFSKLNVWDVDWKSLAAKMGVAESNGELADPRSRLEKWVHRWLGATQARSDEMKIRWVQRGLRVLGW